MRTQREVDPSFMDQVRQRTKRTVPLQTKELIEELNRYCGDGASTISAPTFESSSNVSTAGFATHLVAPIQALTQGWLETVAYVPALRRVRACAPARFNSFSFLLVSLSLRESCIRQIRLCSLGADGVSA